MSALTHHLIPVDKQGYEPGDLITSNGRMTVGTMDNPGSDVWQAHQLVICRNMDDKSGISYSEDDGIHEYDDCEDDDLECFSVIASYPHLPNTSDFSPYIQEFVRLQGKCTIEYEMGYSFIAVDGEWEEIGEPQKEDNGNPVFRLIPHPLPIVETRGDCFSSRTVSFVPETLPPINFADIGREQPAPVVLGNLLTPINLSDMGNFRFIDESGLKWTPENKDLYNKLISDPNRLLRIYMQNSELLTLVDAMSWQRSEGLTPEFTVKDMEAAWEAGRSMDWTKRGLDYKYEDFSEWLTKYKNEKV